MKIHSRLFGALITAVLLFTQQACASPAGADNEPQPVETVAPVEETEAPVAATDAANSAAPAGEPGTWLVMLYQNADDEILEEDIFTDLNEAEIVGSTDSVTIVSQIDRFDGAYQGDGDWISSKRYLVTQDDDLGTINSQELADLGEVDSGNKDTLVEFATWAIQTYPADKYVLILSDHGAGWSGGWNDNDPVEGSSFSMQNIDDALGEIIAATGIDAFELVGFDACLMGQLEVMSGIAPHARFAVGSEETEPSLGWAYASFLSDLSQNPHMNGGDLARSIVGSYLTGDFRITDDAARKVFAGGNYSAESVVSDLLQESTLTAIDLTKIQPLNAALNQLALALADVDQEAVAQARSYAQSYENVFGDEVPPSFIDLGNFARLLDAELADPNISAAVADLQNALSDAVIGEMHGDGLPGSSGLTIYFPNSDLYDGTFGDSPAYGIQYTSYIGRFATASLWDDFLTYHYTGESMDSNAADLGVLDPAQSDQADFTRAVQESAPQPAAQVVAPGAGQITIAPITVSASEIGPDGKVTLSTEISGSNIGYIYYYASYLDPESGSYLSADKGFIASETTREVDGIFYPDWGGDGAMTFEFDWEPTLYFISDGNPENDQFAYFEPSVYGVSEEQDVYTVRGVFQYAGSQSQIDAIMEFGGDGKMRSIYGFIGANGAGAPREITPHPGDTFTITEEWLDFDQNPDGEFVDYTGGVMTFGDTDFQMTPYYAYSGEYVLGIIVTDLNGKSVEEFVKVTVTE